MYMVGGVGVGIVSSGAVIFKWIWRELAWVMCVGAGRNLVRISLGLLVVLTPPICTSPWM